GWGGRLAAAAGGNVVALTRTPRPFCFGPHASDPENRSDEWLVPAQDVRNMKLYTPDAGTDPRWANAVMERTLRSYYVAKRSELPQESAFRRFTAMEQQLREFGEPLDTRLQTLPVPAQIEALYNDTGPLLDNTYFGEQIRNLYDAIAVNDIFGMRIASLEYQGFDTHDAQRQELETRLTDIFGSGMAMDALWQSLPADARSNTVFAFAGEFGRQIRANGDAGTDHGEGTSIVLVGEPVNGGVYGDMFPQAELSRLDQATPQIEGLTAIDHVFGRLCDWMQPGSGNVVFPDRGTAPLETGLDLAGLLG
ncbi:MAG: DUF1501 domain-containing protein, partial [Gammaproteobacteria bacterium]|nr:DUF1501 domain-containing protein [Gammaproteobacteria bacterium]